MKGLSHFIPGFLLFQFIKIKRIIGTSCELTYRKETFIESFSIDDNIQLKYFVFIFEHYLAIGR